MKVKLEIPFGSGKVVLFVSNLPSWLAWFIVICSAAIIAMYVFYNKC